MQETVYQVFMSIVTVWGLSIACALVILSIRLIKVKTKNERVKLALEFAEQAVILAERSFSRGQSNEKKDNALESLSKRLSENGIDQYFTVEQLSAYIEMAVVKIKNINFNSDGSHIECDTNEAKSMSDSIKDIEEYENHLKYSLNTDENHEN